MEKDYIFYPTVIIVTLAVIAIIAEFSGFTDVFINSFN